MSDTSKPKRKTDKQLEEECKDAINRVTRVLKGIPIQKMRLEILKVFPFGAEPTSREQRIWDETLRLAISELERWPQTLTG